MDGFESSSSPESSEEEGEGGRRAGGSLSPNAMVRVGGGGSVPNGLRWRPGEGRDTGSCWGDIVEELTIEREGRRGLSSKGETVLRRKGSGGGACATSAESEAFPAEVVYAPRDRCIGGGGTGREYKWLRGGLSLSLDGRVMVSVRPSKLPRETLW